MSIGTKLKNLKPFMQIEKNKWWKLFERILPGQLLEKVIDETNSREKRKRKLTAKIMILFIISMGIFTEECCEQVFAAMLDGIRFLNNNLDGISPKKGLSAKPDTGLAQSL
jgi:hypothetical protein